MMLHPNPDKVNLNLARKGRPVEIEIPAEIIGEVEVGTILTRSGYNALVIERTDVVATVVDLYFPWEN